MTYSADQWCYDCQCFHKPPLKPRSRKCRAAAKARGEDKMPFMHDMLDYN